MVHSSEMYCSDVPYSNYFCLKWAKLSDKKPNLNLCEHVISLVQKLTLCVVLD